MPDTINLNIPGGSIEGWRQIMDRAKNIYWQARMRDKSENDALRAVVDDIISRNETE